MDHVNEFSHAVLLAGFLFSFVAGVITAILWR